MNRGVIPDKYASFGRVEADSTLRINGHKITINGAGLSHDLLRVSLRTAGP